jgi:hypothetical protein
VGLFDIRDRKTLVLAFSKLPPDCGRFGRQPEFFDALRLIDGLEIRRGFLDGAGPWLVTAQPEKGLTWKEIKKRLTTKAKDIPLEKKYNLSPHGRALLQWILDLRSREYLAGMTPPVEPNLKEGMGIKIDWEGKNVRTYLELLVEEINDNTEFNLRTIPWHRYADEQTRILVKKKSSEIERIVRAVQHLALTENRVLDSERVMGAIQAIINT